MATKFKRMKAYEKLCIVIYLNKRWWHLVSIAHTELQINTSVFPFLLGIVLFRSKSVLVPPHQDRNGRTEWNDLSLGEERNDENRENDNRPFVPKLALQERWMENTLKCVTNPNFSGYRSLDGTGMFAFALCVLCVLFSAALCVVRYA